MTDKDVADFIVFIEEFTPAPLSGEQREFAKGLAKALWDNGYRAGYDRAMQWACNRDSTYDD